MKNRLFCVVLPGLLIGLGLGEFQPQSQSQLQFQSQPQNPPRPVNSSPPTTSLHHHPDFSPLGLVRGDYRAVRIIASPRHHIASNYPRIVSTPLIPTSVQSPYIKVLGIAQDGGYPHAGCEKNCCREAWEGKTERQLVSCLALVDPATGQSWMLDATPDFKDQQYLLKKETGRDLSGIFLTHAHIGHYTGLMQLGREVIGTRDVPVYAMPRMQEYLRTNGPWSQLVDLQNITLQPLQADSTIRLSDQLRITPFRVPHRDEYSETVGYRIDGPNRSAVFIPDIDKWEKWDRSIDSLLQTVDYAFVDGTFFQNGEIPGRDMSEIPHPFIRESIARFQKAGIDPGRVTFIHFNHTNPVMQPGSPERREVLEAGFGVAETGQRTIL